MRLGVRVWRVILKVVIGSCCYWLSFSASTCICIGYDRVVPKSLNTPPRAVLADVQLAGRVGFTLVIVVAHFAIVVDRELAKRRGEG